MESRLERAAVMRPGAKVCGPPGTRGMAGALRKPGMSEALGGSARGDGADGQLAPSISSLGFRRVGVGQKRLVNQRDDESASAPANQHA